MPKALFETILAHLVGNHPYFEQKYDAVTKEPGPTPLQKVTTAMRILAYGHSYFSVGSDVTGVSPQTASDCLKEFCKAIVSSFSAKYLRQPTREDVAKITASFSEFGFPGLNSPHSKVVTFSLRLPRKSGCDEMGMEKLPQSLGRAVPGKGRLSDRGDRGGCRQ